MWRARWACLAIESTLRGETTTRRCLSPTRRTYHPDPSSTTTSYTVDLTPYTPHSFSLLYITLAALARAHPHASLIVCVLSCALTSAGVLCHSIQFSCLARSLIRGMRA